MTVKSIEIAIAEAERFSKRAQEVLATKKDWGPGSSQYLRGKESVAAKRASMDLSRALADVRNPE